MSDTTATTAGEGPEKTGEVWTYAGVRESVTGKHLAWWRLPDRKFIGYITKTSGYILGGLYDVTVSREERDNRVVTAYWGEPTWKGTRTADEDLIRQWRAEEVAALASMERAKLLRAAKRVDPLDEALAPLIEIASHLRTNAARDAFALHVLRKITGAAW